MGQVTNAVLGHRVMYIQRARRDVGECAQCGREGVPGLTLELGLSAHSIAPWLRAMQLRVDVHWCDACRGRWA